MSSPQDFIAEDDIFIDAEGKVVAKKDARSKLASKGARVSPADVEKYGLQAKGKNAVVHGADADHDSVPTLKGKLPEDFPGYTELEAAGLTTYARVRKHLDKFDTEEGKVPGIGPATTEKIRAAMNESSEEDEEQE